MKNKSTRMMIDISMTVILPLLMAYSLIGEKFHEIAGTLMLLLFIAHHVMNRAWFKGMFKGKYSARRTFQTILDVLLLVFMIMQPVSGILMSKHLYTFIQVPSAASVMREIHLVLAYWGFVLMCIHAGTHLTAPFGRLKREKGRAWMWVMTLLTIVSLYGCFALVKRQLAAYMFMRSAFVFFDFSEPRIFFFMDYIAIMVLFSFIGYLIATALTKNGKVES